MQIIISPAKKMRIDNDDLVSAAEPRFLFFTKKTFIYKFKTIRKVSQGFISI